MEKDMIRSVEFYQAPDGRRPIQEFFGSLSGREMQKVAWTLRLLERLDTVPRQYLKKLTGTEDIWECRVKTPAGIYRIFGFLFEGGRFILTHGYAKKTQKTDPRQIARAERYRRDFLDRHRRE